MGSTEETDQARLDAARWRYVRDHSTRGTQDTKTTWSWHFTPRGFAGSMEELVDIHMAREKEKTP